MAAFTGRGRLKMWVAGSVIGLSILGVASWLALPSVVERSLVSRLTAAGIQVSRMDVVEVGLSETVISNIAIGTADQFTAARVVARYSIIRMLNSEVDEIEIQGLRMAGVLDADGLSVGVAPITGGGGQGRLTLQHAPAIKIVDGRIDLTTRLGQLALPVDGTIHRVDGGALMASLRSGVKSDFGGVTGRIELRLGDEGVEGTLFIDDGRVGAGRTMMSGMTGKIDVAWNSVTGPSLAGNINFRESDLAGASYGGGRTRLLVKDNTWSMSGSIGGDDTHPAVRVNLSVIDSNGKKRFALGLGGRLPADAPMWALLELPQPAAGSVDLELQLDGSWPDQIRYRGRPSTVADIVGLLSGAGVVGRVDIRASQLAYRNLASVTTPTTSFDVRAFDDVLWLNPRSSIQATGAFSHSILDSLGVPSEAIDQISGPLTVNAQLTAPISIAASAHDTTIRIEGAASVENEAGAKASIGGRGRARMTDELGILDYSLADGTVTISALPMGHSVVETMACRGSVEGSRDGFEAAVNVSGTLTGAALEAIKPDEIEFALSTTLSLKRGRLDVRLTRDGSVALRGVSGPLVAGRLVGMTLPVVASDAPLLTGHVDQGGLTDFAHEISLGAFKTMLPLLIGGTKPTRVAIKSTTAQISGNWTPGSGYRAVADLPHAVVTLPGQGITVQGLRAEISVPPGGGAQSFKLQFAKINSDATPATFVPLSLSADASLAGDLVTMKVKLSPRRSPFEIVVDAAHAIAEGRGQARIKTAQVTFAPGKLHPRDIFPAVGARIASAQGSAAIAGTFSWNNGKIKSDLKLLLQDISLALPQIDVGRLNSVIAIKSLVPFATERSQQAAVGLLDVGVPLSDALASFRIEPGPKLVVEDAQLSLAEGRVTVDPIAFDPGSPRVDTTLHVADVKLDRLLELAAIDGLTATGRLTGEIPLILRDGAVEIRGAALNSTEPGVLRYAPKETPSALQGAGESVALALQALSNFHYTELRLTLDRRAGGDTTAVMHVKGSNPDFYGGYPVEFNLNLSGKLDQIIDRGLASYRIPDSIREQLERFPR